jgi:hypothetical protein
VPRAKYAMEYRPKNCFSMSFASRMVIFPDVYLDRLGFYYTDCTLSLPTAANQEESFKDAPEDDSHGLCLYGLTEIWTCYGTQQEGEVLHVYLDRESQHPLMSCMRMKTCMEMVAV